MDSKQKLIGAASVFSLAAVLLAGLVGWKFFENRLPSIKPQAPASWNIPDPSADEEVSAKIEDFSLKGTKASSPESPEAPASGTAYQTNFDMAIRKEPDSQAEKAGNQPKGQKVKIIETQPGKEGSTWGKLADGNWICISDSEHQYLTKAN